MRVSNLYIILILIVGFFLRLINIDKPEGLWNDEYVSWAIASVPFNENFWQAVIKQCHMPLYYLYLKPFANCSDLILRLTSVIPSIISIFVMYLVGKEYSHKQAYICAATTAILPFLIYYSQEVRFYSLLFLFSAFALLFTIRLIKNNNAWRGYIISSILILLTHVLGIFYVVATLCYIGYKKKKLSGKIILGTTIIISFLIPFGTNILRMLPSSQWWGVFSYTNILFLFSDYLSPILTNNINAPATFFYSKSILFQTLIFFPTLIGMYYILQGIKKAKGLALIALFIILTTAILAIFGKIVFITKYTIEILPILLLLFSLGCQGKFNKLLLSSFIAFQLFSIFTPYYPAKAFRSEGHKLVTDILNNTKSNKIVFTYYEPNRFTKYLNTKQEMLYISKINRFEYLDNPAKILDNINVNETVSVVFLDSVSFIPDFWIENAKDKHLPEMFISFSQIRNSIIKELNKNYKNFDVKKSGSWTIITATKLR